MLGLIAVSFAVGCRGALPHDFPPQQATIYGLIGGPYGDDLGRAPVLLIPRNVRLMAARRGPGGMHLCASCDTDGAVGGHRGAYRGPAQILLWPGAHHFVLSVTTAGGVVELDLDLQLVPHQRLQLEINEFADKVEASVNELDEEAYRALYP